MRLAIHIGAYIQQNCCGARGGGKNRRQRGTIDAGQRTQHHFCRCHGGAGVAGGNKAIGAPFAHQPQTYAHGGVAFGANSLHRLILHGDHFTGMDDLDRQARRRRDDGRVRL